MARRPSLIVTPDFRKWCGIGYPHCHAPAVAVSVSRMGGVLVPVDEAAAEYAASREGFADGVKYEGPYLPRASHRFGMCAAHAEWSNREYQYHLQVPTDTPEAEIARLEALPYVVGGMNGDPLYGDCHTWLSNGALVCFTREGLGWRWATKDDALHGHLAIPVEHATGFCTDIEEGRQQAAQALGVPAEMTPEEFGTLMGWYWEPGVV